MNIHTSLTRLTVATGVSDNADGTYRLDFQDGSSRLATDAEILAATQAVTIAANQAEAKRRIHARFPAEVQTNILAGQDPDLHDACWGANGWVALHRAAENAAAALIEAATTVAEVEAITVNWPE
jgi:hypothetical protein